MGHEKGAETTIKLYGWVEMNLEILPHANDAETDQILDRELHQVVQEMKDDFWRKYRQIKKH